MIDTISRFQDIIESTKVDYTNIGRQQIKDLVEISVKQLRASKCPEEEIVDRVLEILKKAS